MIATSVVISKDFEVSVSKLLYRSCSRRLDG